MARQTCAVYRGAIARDLYKNAYAAGNPAEYWAEIVQSYFDCNRVNNWNHGPIGTREQLKLHDPAGYELVRRRFRLEPDHDWRYTWLRTLPNVAPPPERLSINPYYTRFTWAREFQVVGRQAGDRAMLVANQTIRKMFAYRHDLLKALMASGVRLVILGHDEKISDLPEYRSGNGSKIDRLARVVEYSPETRTVVVGEENVLRGPSEPCVGPNQVIRVFARAIHDVAGTRPVDPNWNKRGSDVQQYELRVERLDVRFDQKLEEHFKTAISAGKWKGTSAARIGSSTGPPASWPTSTLSARTPFRQALSPGLHARGPQGLRSRPVRVVAETMAYEGHVDWRFKPAEALPGNR